VCPLPLSGTAKQCLPTCGDDHSRGGPDDQHHWGAPARPPPTTHQKSHPIETRTDHRTTTAQDLADTPEQPDRCGEPQLGECRAKPTVSTS
jgi:hypothetical protein